MTKVSPAILAALQRAAAAKRAAAMPNLPPVFEPEVSHTMVDDFAIRASRLRARSQPAGIPPVYPVPMRGFPMWTGNNELGRETEFAPDDNNRQMILKMDEFGMPQMWTCALGISYSDDGFTAPGAALGVVAELQMGSGGTVQLAEIDWLNGVQFSAPFNTIVVTARYFASSSNIPTDIRLRATVGRDPRGRGPLPTRTIQVPALITGGGTVQSASFRIPAFARSVTVIDRTNGANITISANTSLQFLSTPTGGQVQEIDGNFLQNYPNGYPIGIFANYVRLEARNPQVSWAPTLIFNIDL